MRGQCTTLPASGCTCVSSAWHWDIYTDTAALVTAWLGAGLAATYRVLELDTCCQHTPGGPPGCAPHCNWVGGLLATADACNHKQHQALV